MVQYNPKYVRGAPGVNERLLALDSGLRASSMSFVTSGFLTTHESNTGGTIGGSWRCIRQGAAPWVAGDTWKTYGSSASGADTTGWRYGKLPFPSTICVSAIAVLLGGNKQIQIMVKGLDQFGRPMTETSPLIGLYQQNFNTIGLGATVPVTQTMRIYLSRVFSEVTTISYRVYGAAPGAFELNVGQHFTFNSVLAASAANVTPGLEHLEQFYFPANQGIGVGRLLAQERGTVSSRYPEIRVLAWDGQQGPNHTVQVLPHSTEGAAIGGIFMGYTDQTHWRFHAGLTADQDLLDTLAGGSARYSGFDNEPLKFRIDHSPASAVGTNTFVALNVNALDASAFLFYDPAVSGTKFNNPKTIHWSVGVFTQLGALSPRMDVSERVNS